MVFGVCKRVTGNHHLAEDAFQAVFVVLAAKAGCVRPRAALPAWLYGVAYRTALRARTMSDRRRKRERATARPESESSTLEAADTADVVAVLDEEIARLPDHLRLAVIACELRGRSRAEAAVELGVKEGTLSSRLAAARKALARRFRQRGVALSAAGLSTAFGRTANASVPADLAGRTIAAALTPSLVPAPVADLSHGVSRLMLAHKLKAVPIALALAAVTFAGVATTPGADTPGAPRVAQPGADTPGAPHTPDSPRKAAPKPLPKGPNRLLFYKSGHLCTIDPDGTNEKQVVENGGTGHASDARFSPDGKRIAYLVDETDRDAIPPGGGIRKATIKLHVRELGDEQLGTELGIECQTFAWSPDGTQIACSDFMDGPNDGVRATHTLVNVATKEKTTLKLPADHIITDWSRDGKHLVTTSAAKGPVEPFLATQLFLMNRDGTVHKKLNKDQQQAALGRLSPDGKQVLCMTYKFEQETPAEKKERENLGKNLPRPEPKLAILDVATGKITPVADFPLNGELQDYCWSPDGKRIAYTWRQMHEGKPEDLRDLETESHLVVCDPDGSNATTIVSEKAPGQWIISIGGVDWR